VLRIAIVTGAMLLAPVSHVWAASCGSLVSLTFPDARVMAAGEVAAGAFVPPGSPPNAGAARLFASLPAFCRVAMTLTPSSDSEVRVEVWLPASGWNGKFQAVGNGGWAGVISYSAMAAAAASGYATASTDTGHVGNTAAFALGHPEKVIDFGYRAVHEMTLKAKAIIDAFYGAAPTLAIWNGCSQGGRQGITEAVRYPADFDAVIAGAPGVNYMHLHAGRMAVNRAVNSTPASVIPAAKYPFIHQAALNACDARDGVADGVIENPGTCVFDPKVLQCTGADEPTCLTPPQVESASRMYATTRNPDTKAEILPGLAPGSELGWGIIGGPRPLGLVLDAYRYIVAKENGWEPSKFKAEADLDRALAADTADTLGSTNADLRPFFNRGGKLLIYHGWSDPQITPYNTIKFFYDVLEQQGGAGVGSSIQLYMVPGMNHCARGPGTDSFDKVGAMEDWVRTGFAPFRIEASHVTNGVVDRTRPVCPFGQVARWNGQGSTDVGANFSCVVSSVVPQR